MGCYPGMVSISRRVRILRRASAACLVGLAATAALATPTGPQDVTALVAQAHRSARWQGYLAAVSQGSVHVGRFGGGATPAAVPLGGPGRDAILAVERRRQGPDAAVVNRAGKGDLPMTRLGGAAPQPALPASGTIWEMKDVFSAYDAAALPKVAFAAVRFPDDATLVAAYSAFSRPAAATAAPAILTAAAAPRSPAVHAPGDWASPYLAAYAPQGAGIEAPFEAVIGGDSRLEAPQAVAPPRIRPAPETLLGWLRQRFRGSHAWAANPLPPSAFTTAEQKCLAEGIYFESRGESADGQAAVAQVILNRVKNPAYPDTICGVVYQNRSWRGRCQFSFACDGIKDRVLSPSAWRRAQQIAADVTSGKVWLEEVGDSTHYHANYVRPRWARTMKKVDRIGRHIFYRTYGGGWS